MSLADLVEAGAPKLPEGWFYRVKYVGWWTEVELRRRTRFGSHEVASAVIREDDFPDAQSAVVDACRRVCDKADELAARYARAQGINAFIGDHDPRRTK